MTILTFSGTTDILWELQSEFCAKIPSRLAASWRKIRRIFCFADTLKRILETIKFKNYEIQLCYSFSSPAVFSRHHELTHDFRDRSCTLLRYIKCNEYFVILLLNS